MDEETQSFLVFGVGVAAVILTLTDRYLAFLKPSMRLPLLASGLVLMVVAAGTFLRWYRHLDDEVPAHDHEDHGDHEHGSRAAWLLLLPPLALMLIAPAPLGADAVDTSEDVEAIAAAPPPATTAPPSIAESEPLTMSLTDFQSAAYGTAEQLAVIEEQPVRLTGFVAPVPDHPDQYLLTRFAIQCCAADGTAIQVYVYGAPQPIPAENTWVEVVGTWVEPPLDQFGTPLRGLRLQVIEQREIPPPTNPYE